MRIASGVLLLLIAYSVVFGQVIHIGTRLTYDRSHLVAGGYFDATYFDSTYFDTGGD